jgi:hypothetical protein
MPIRLNITIDEDVYAELKAQLPAKRMSAFINAAVKARLAPNSETLDAAYRAARRESWRRGLDDDWAGTEVEQWPL